MKTSLIATVLNEEDTIDSFIISILSQTKKPDEIIIVDGGSTDTTVSVISNFKFQISNKKKKFRIKLIVKPGNRSIGRNEGIKRATGDLILISDAGCVLDKNWIKNIIKPFSNPKVDVVAGYYNAIPQTVFQKCLIPYVLVMPDRVDETNFLPASRSMALRKKVWKQLGGFNEKYSHNEDYVFSRELKKMKKKIIFRKDAIVYWIPRENIHEAFSMFYRFAFGDAEAGIIRPKVVLIFLRFFLFLLLLYLSLFNYFHISFMLQMLIAYILWCVGKNYKYIKNIRAFYYLPLLQITSDVAVLLGTTQASIRRILLTTFNT